MTLPHNTGLKKDPFMGILMLDTTFPGIINDIGHHPAFGFLVRDHTVNGATPERVKVRADRSNDTPVYHRRPKPGSTRGVGRGQALY